jgi:uncharacterized phage protein (TIGR01671 family)
MNNLKFRAWDKKEKKMYLVNTLMIGFGSSGTTIDEDEVDVGTMDDNFIIIQSTGLFDKNGVEIFAGDIVKSFLDEPAIVKFGKYMAGGDDYYAQDAYGFYVQRILKGKEIKDDTETLVNHEIIGNIYENPELLNNQA